MKYNDNIYFYQPKMRLFGSWVFIIKDEDSSIKGTELNQYLIEGCTSKKGGRIELNVKEMEEDGIDIKDTKGIFLTHEHPDHCTGTNKYKELIGSDVPIYFNNDWTRMLEEPDYIKELLDKEMEGIRKEFTKIPTNLLDKGFDFLWGKRISMTNVKGIKEGDTFPLGKNSHIEAFDSPGHTVPHMSFMIHCSNGDKVLMSGDSISFKEDDGELLALASINNPISTYTGEIETLKKMMNMHIDVLFTSHYGDYKGNDWIQGKIKEAYDRIYEFKDRVLEELKEGPLTIPELSKKVITMPKYLGGYATRESTIYVILKHLIGEGKVTMDAETIKFALV